MPKYMMDLSVLVAQVREVAVEVGAFLREQRAAFDRSAVQEKGPHDYVSYVDNASGGATRVAQLSPGLKPSVEISLLNL